MGWVAALGLAALVALALWRFGKVRGAAFQLVGAGLCLALAGYAWQGRPDLASRTPDPRAEDGQVADSDFARTREDMLGRFDRAGVWLTIADSYLRRGSSREAVGVLRSGIRARPRDPDLWIGLGNALVVHGGGTITPAAQLAFDRAEQLAPGHPAPRFFYGLALVQSGRIDEAEQAWREVLRDAPADASWRPIVEQRLQILAEIRAVLEGRAPAQGLTSPSRDGKEGMAPPPGFTRSPSPGNPGEEISGSRSR